MIAGGLTVAYIAFGIYVSAPWRSDLREAIGPIMAWVIPIMLAYIPGLLIGLLAFTLLTLRYRVPSLDPPRAGWQADDRDLGGLPRLALLGFDWRQVVKDALNSGRPLEGAFVLAVLLPTLMFLTARSLFGFARWRLQRELWRRDVERLETGDK